MIYKDSDIYCDETRLYSDTYGIYGITIMNLRKLTLCSKGILGNDVRCHNQLIALILQKDPSLYP